jgi:acyl-CoA reductase-like NAD-dependent aldehyde dehydrogenase
VSAVPELGSFIDGGWSTSGAVQPDLNPARPDEVVAVTHLADVHVVLQAADAARRAMGAWQRTPAPARGEILRRAAGILAERAESIATDFASEEGKPYWEALGETRRGSAILNYYAGQTLEPDGETYPSHSERTLLFARREPLGVVLAITPWNFPVAIPIWKIAPALAYGNTVVWKPAELVPLTSVRIAEVFRDAGLPAGVLNIVLGRGSEIGDQLVTAEPIHAITFTGSSEVGRSLHVLAVKEGKKVQLELGGKNPVVVLADANLDLAAEMIARGAFFSAGQKCSATSRVIADQHVYDDLTGRLAATAKAWKLGDPLDEDTKVGPLVSDERLRVVMGYVEIARREGAEVVAGGDRPVELGAGFFYMPTVLRELSQDSAVMREEVFGPVVAVSPAGGYEEAIAAANDTPFGLAASVFTSNVGLAIRAARDLQAGVVKVNQEGPGMEYQVPFGGMKGSSSGTREQGKVARDFFTQWKTVYIDPPTMP